MFLLRASSEGPQRFSRVLLEISRVLDEEALGGAAFLRTSGKIFPPGQSGNLFLVRLGGLIALE